ncbi:S41 family peptidase [Rhodothermus profundi]|uniref:Tricorn protease homolog n=1 Tax=Rhodothermus profundi TaxID=633813 RepID=A0A1M6UJA9_9BACT|nr:S41 family peptidase [Rhodothermus profundi]SHK69302.1 tricorn protease [Rhodothermus profundi]
MGSLLVLLLAFLALDPKPFPRYPAIDPTGQQIVFSYQGDLWLVPVTGGLAQRLTVHPAYEAYPRWSPDGQRIAFTSDRYGHDDLFVMELTGGPPRRLTYHSADDILTDWTRDGHLLFHTRRLFVQVEREAEIHAIPDTGGTPVRILDATGFQATRSPDGRFLAFERGSNAVWRKGYRGAANRDIWLFDAQQRIFRRLTDFDGNDYLPAWAGPRTLLFLSERDGTYNLYRLQLTEDGIPARAPEQLTHFKGDGIRYFTVSADGQTIAFERQTDLYVLALPEGTPRRLEIQVPYDERFDPVERRTFTSNATEYALSPDGQYVAFVVRGELFLRRNDPDDRRTVRLTRHPWRDREPAWLNDSTLVFVSDRAGQYDLYLLRAADAETSDLFESLTYTVVRLTDTPEDERAPVVAPDGQHLVFRRGRGTLLLARITGDQLQITRTLLDGWATPEDIAWSPDSRWIAYSLPDLDFNTEVYIQPIDGSHPPVNISQHPKPDTHPVWSPDGSKLAFLSPRSSGDVDVWFAWLRRSDWERTEEEWEALQQTRRKRADTLTGPLQIDLERIHERLRRVTALPGNEAELAISKDGETFYFVANRGGRTQNYEAEVDLYRIRWDGTELKRLTENDTDPRQLRLSRDGKYLFFLRPSGQIVRLNPENGRQETLRFEARMTIDYREERRQIFEEAWRTLAQGFYDPQFHGVDWQALHDKYLPWALQASTNRDFRDVFSWMLGELNASHLGLFGPDRTETQRERTGLLGVEVEPVPEGVRIRHVVPGAPADREDSRLHVGEIITAVDGTPVSEVDNFYRLLVDKVDQRVRLTVRARDGQRRTVVIRPVGSLRQALYEEWVAKRRALTERYSNGRLGYIHVQGMNWPSFERFERELVASGQGKEGLIIDVRYNGGGWTTDYLLTVLTVRRHAYTIPRGAAARLDLPHRRAFRAHYPFGERLPFAAWTKPVAALCNQNSFSNAEIFSHAFKNLGLGPLVGTPTFGAVISTGGVRLIDGSFVRLPFRGWFVYADDTNMENGPAIPDIIVEEAPDSKARGEDPQLRAAVEALLARIDARPTNPAH